MVTIRKKSVVEVNRLVWGLTVAGIILVSSMVLIKQPKYLVREVLADGTLELSDSKKIKLAGIKLPDEGEEKYEASIFLLSEMTKDVEVWIQSQGEDYKVWIGCSTRPLGVKGCKNGILVNEALVKAGVAESR